MTMAESRQRHNWSMASTLIATLINVNGGDDGRAVSADEFNPFAKKPEKPTAEVIQEEVACARDMWKAHYG